MFISEIASTRPVVQRPKPIQINQGEFSPKTSMTSQPALTSLLPTSTVMTSQLCNLYDYSSPNLNKNPSEILDYDLRPNMRYTVTQLFRFIVI